ncbi:heme biosynthesis HemY N-terminal domain-containing protein [Candidatus Pseudomonas adelgestsugas]|uniref:Protoheme IX biogenesis protein n=1 Tax=Candidatus Pseudomonas adelgestsugas TaxID=1302376 RepID=A0ABX5R6Z7_9PSED|nr:heme biosynthesis HemY N-terminal domain-containing protein [Candidatus Pseudomonas adelgestsugas]QAX81417.1 putative protoheme IX biogenesis protein [Candidatus Pseudomonas adelgestsugas]
MKRFHIILVFVIAIAIILCVSASKHTGYVLITYPHLLHYESSLWAMLVAVFAILLAIYLILVLLRLLITFSGVLNPWSRRNRIRRVQIAIENGPIDLAEGRWASAERYLHCVAESERYPLLYYLGAARAANEQGRYKESDGLLERALERQPHAELAVALSHAQLQMDRGDTDGTLVTLQAMYERYPHHAQVLRQLQRLHQQRGDWPLVIRLLSELRKDKELPDAELAELERRAWGIHLGLVIEHEEQNNAGLQYLEWSWKQLTSARRQEPQLVLTYAEQLRLLGADAKAEEVLRGAIKCGYDSYLIRLYGLLRGSDPRYQLKFAESWLEGHPGDASLLLTLGRLCLQNSLWGKAHSYFEGSLQVQRNPEACAELARLLDQLGDSKRSNQLFQESLKLLDSRLLALPLPTPTHA